MTDEEQAFDMGIAINAIIAVGAADSGPEPLFFILTDGFYLHSGFLCQFSDLHGSSPFSGFQTIFIPVGIAVSESYRKYRIIAS